MGFRNTNLDDIFKNGSRDYPKNDVFDCVLTRWSGDILQVNNQKNLGNEN